MSLFPIRKDERSGPAHLEELATLYSNRGHSFRVLSPSEILIVADGYTVNDQGLVLGAGRGIDDPDLCDAILAGNKEDILQYGQSSHEIPIMVAELPAPSKMEGKYVLLEPFFDTHVVAHKESGVPVQCVVYRKGGPWEYFDPLKATWKEVPHAREASTQSERDAWIDHMRGIAMKR